ncbi:hypothetical protein RJG79_09010 [Mycoplasmatota bacterium WC44]
MNKIFNIFMLLMIVTLYNGCMYEFDWGPLYEETKTLEELVAEYGEDKAFTHNHYFPQANDNIVACINKNMDREYIDASIDAIAIWNEIDGIQIDYELSTKCQEQVDILSFSIYTGDEEVTYCESLNDEPDNGYGDEKMACNIYFFKDDTGEIGFSFIKYNLANMDKLPYNEKLTIAVHELGHTFGLVDFKDKELRKYTVMFHAHSGRIQNGELTEFDLYNINWMYNNRVSK